MNVLIADDERIVLDGLKCIIDWNNLGFSICDTAQDGAEALQKILTLKPDLVLMDIRMPKMQGIEVIQKAVEQGFKGKFIILSGVSDFKFAQTAMRYGVDFYLTKPIDEEELENAVLSIYKTIQKQQKTMISYETYRDHAKQSILQDILNNRCNYEQLNKEELYLNANMYQVIFYENYNHEYFYNSWNFADLMRVTSNDNGLFDVIQFEKRKIILLKGDFAISKFDQVNEFLMQEIRGSFTYEESIQKMREILG